MRFTHGCLFRCDNSICCAQKTDDTCRQSEELVHIQVSYEIYLPRHWLYFDGFVVSISHELRTPLHGILAAAELLSDTQLNHTQSSFLQTVQACGTSLVETVNHVLDFTKLSGNSKAGGVEHVIRSTKYALHYCLSSSYLTVFTKISSSNPQD
jgi:signal transduction histidine kinase